jgi:hypothetical protein
LSHADRLLLQKFDLATQLYQKLEDLDPGIAKGLPLYHARVFFFALICMHNAKQPKSKRKHKAEGKKYLEVVRGWVVDKRAINLVHKLMILEAEMMTVRSGKKVLRSKIKDASFHATTSLSEGATNAAANTMLIAAFDKAIAASAKTGFLQDAALACHVASRAAADEEVSNVGFISVGVPTELWSI